MGKKLHKDQNPVTIGILDPLVFPPRAQRSPPGHRPKRANPLLKSIKILIIFGHRFGIDFWLVLGRHLGLILGTFGGQVGSSSAPKRVLKAYQHQKCEISPNTMPADTAAISRRPRWPSKRSKIGPRRLQEALEEQLFRC